MYDMLLCCHKPAPSSASLQKVEVWGRSKKEVYRTHFVGNTLRTQHRAGLSNVCSREGCFTVSPNIIDVG